MAVNLNIAARCPYCGNLLDKMPQRKKKCSVCGEFMYVRTHPHSHQKIIVTEGQMKEIDLEWSRIQKRKDIISIIMQFSLTEQDFINYQVYFSNYYHRFVQDRETLWLVMNELTLKITDLFALKMLYYHMALFLDEEGQDYYPYLRKSNELQLLQYRANGTTQVRILVVSNCCSSCRRYENVIMSLDDALKNIPIPNANCTRQLNNGPKGFCRCHYLPTR